MEQKNIDLAKVSGNKVDYSKLANVIKRAKRRMNAPTVVKASLSQEADGRQVLAVEGSNLAMSAAGDFPLEMQRDGGGWSVVRTEIREHCTRKLNHGECG